MPDTYSGSTFTQAMDVEAQTAQNSEQLLSQDHVALNRLLKNVLAALDGEDAQNILECLDLFWARLAMHIRAEHLHLFPSIIEALRGDAEPPQAEEIAAAIVKLREDHDFYMKSLAGAVASLRHLRNKSVDEQTTVVLLKVREILSTITRSLNHHNEVEEQLIYRLPQALLTGPQQSMMLANIARELENLPPRFHAGETTNFR